MPCKYCHNATCHAEQHRDDARLLRICRHNVQLERDFFRNRLARYEAVPARPAAESWNTGQCPWCAGMGCAGCYVSDVGLGRYDYAERHRRDSAPSEPEYPEPIMPDVPPGPSAPLDLDETPHPAHICTECAGLCRYTPELHTKVNTSHSCVRCGAAGAKSPLLLCVNCDK